VIANELEVSLENILVRFGDTAFTPYGTGSYASRGVANHGQEAAAPGSG
jgi:CO/xanthine dehydrogenase Mo-binding subunit